MPYNLTRESQSFWKFWNKGLHAKIVSEILMDDIFRDRARIEIKDPEKRADLTEVIVRMTGNRIGQEIVRKAGGDVERDTHSDAGSVFIGLEPGTARGIAGEIVVHKAVKKILEPLEDDEDPEGELDGVIDEFVKEVSRMTGRAVGKLMGLDMSKILEVGKKIIEKIF